MNYVNKIESYDIEGLGMPVKVQMKLGAFHIPYLSAIDQGLNRKHDIRLSVSSKSGYRSESYEKLKKRSGRSEHTFKNMGAVDITCSDFSRFKEVLLFELMTNTNYTRLAVYDTFIHCDYKNEMDERFVYNSKWQRQYQFNKHGRV